MPRYRFDHIAINSTEKKKPVAEDRFTYLGLEHLDSGSLRVTRFGSDVPPIGEKLIMHKGDVLFGKRRAYQKKVAIAPFDGIFSAHGMVLRPKENVIDKDFFPLFISSDYFLDAAIKISVGSLSPTINWRDLKELEFSLPDLDAQKRLAGVLWAMVETMDSYKDLLAATDELEKAQFIDMFGDETKYPMIQLSEIAEIIAGGDKPKDVSDKKTEQYCYPIYANGIEKEGLQCFAKEYRVDKEAVTISARGTIGATFVREPYFTPIVRLITVIPSASIDATYLKHAIDLVGVTGNGSSQQQLTVPNISKVKIPVPEIGMQKKYSSFVKQSIISKIELKNALDELNATYKSLVAKKLGSWD